MFAASRSLFSLFASIAAKSLDAGWFRAHALAKIPRGVLRCVRFVALLVTVLASTEVDAAQFTLTWLDNSTNETGFRIERSTNGSTFAEIATVATNVTTYTDRNLPNSTSYWYRIRAFNSAGNSGYSNTANGTTPAANTAPTIGSIANVTISAGGSTGPIAFTIGDAETAAGSLAVSASSSNTALIPQSGLVLGGTGTARTITATAAAGQSGSATITVVVSDGSLNASRTFVVTVNPPTNAAPTISAITNRTISEDSTTGAIAFTVADANHAATSLVVTAASSNTTLVPASAITLGGSGSSRTVTVAPAGNASGTATITLSVSDGSLSASTSFAVTVTAVNDAPTISAITNRTIPEDSTTGVIAFTVADADHAATNLVVTAASSNTALVPASAITLSGSGSSRTVTVAPAGNVSGTATITLSVSDGSLSAARSFVLTVSAVNDAPTISAVANRTIDEDSTTGAIAFTVADPDHAATSLIVTAASSNAALVPASAIKLGGSELNRTVTVVPAGNASGTATITVSVSDGSISASTSFVVTVTAVNDAPTISAVSNQTIEEDASTGPIAFVVNDVDGIVDALTVSAASSNEALVPVSAVAMGGNGSNRTVAVTPTSNANGTATITLAVTDGTLSTSRSFTVTVNAVNDSPTVSGIADQTLQRDGSSGALAFTVGDVDSDASTLTVTAQSSDVVLVPQSGLSLGGSGSNRTLTVTPAAGKTGSATITVTISDGTSAVSTSFAVAVVALSNIIADAGDGFINTSLISPQTGTFEARFDAMVSGTAVDAVVSLSPRAASRYADLAAIVRFNKSGSIDARAGSVYTASNVIRYEAGVSYGFRIVVDVRNRVYSAYVTGPGGAETVIGETFAFRTEQAAATTLAFWSVQMDKLQTGQWIMVSDFEISITPDNSAPAISTIEDVTVTQGASSQPIAFVIGDAESIADDLVVTASSSNSSIVSPADIALGGTGANRTITVSPSGSMQGTATITITISDGKLIETESFDVTIAPPPPIVAVAGAGFLNTALPYPNVGTFEVRFDASPSGAKIDAVMGLSAIQAKAYADLATIVRFNTSGTIDARNRSQYAAATMIPYSAGTTYRFRMVINVAQKTYSAYVTPAGGSELVIGEGFGFRSEQSTVASLSFRYAQMNSLSTGQSVTVSNFWLSKSP